MPDDELLLKRIVRAYGAQRLAAPRGNDEGPSGVWDESGWNGSQAELLAALDAGDVESVGGILRTMFLQPALTGIAMGAQESAAIHSSQDLRDLYALQWLDSFAGLCQEVGALPTPNPEVDGFGYRQALQCDPVILIERLRTITNIALAFPRVGSPFGCRVEDAIIPRVTLFHYLLAWHVMSRPRDLHADTIVEFGGGFGGLAYLLAGRACRRYLGVDLPGACAIQAYFLGMARPDLKLRLFDEPSTQSPHIWLVPSWAFSSQSRAECVRAPLLLNQDCLLEMPPTSAVKLIRAVHALEPSAFLSVSPDVSGSSMHPRGERVADLVHSAGGWRCIDRAPFTPRPGYWRETYAPCRK
jgi:hypothetical protein